MENYADFYRENGKFSLELVNSLPAAAWQNPILKLEVMNMEVLTLRVADWRSWVVID